MGDDGLNNLDWVVWDLAVRDPARITEPGIGNRTARVMTELAGTLGCVFIQCCDDDDVDDVPYYSWLVRIPAAEHARRNDERIPVVIAALHAHLRTQIPAEVDDWQVRPDRDLSLSDDADRGLRRAYDDLLDPLEVALLGLRRDGAQAMEPGARCWWRTPDTTAGTYTLWLCADPDVEPAQQWLLVQAGMTLPGPFWLSREGRGLQRLGADPDVPVLLLPRPTACPWMVTVTSGPFLPRADGGHPRAVGASHRWTSSDSHRLAQRVAADLTALFPAPPY